MQEKNETRVRQGGQPEMIIMIIFMIIFMIIMIIFIIIISMITIRMMITRVRQVCEPKMEERCVNFTLPSFQKVNLCIQTS